MTLPDGMLNLQQVVRELEKRVSALEGKHLVVTEALDAGQAQEVGSEEEPPKAD